MQQDPANAQGCDILLPSAENKRTNCSSWWILLHWAACTLFCSDCILLHSAGYMSLVRSHSALGLGLNYMYWSAGFQALCLLLRYFITPPLSSYCPFKKKKIFLVVNWESKTALWGTVVPIQKVSSHAPTYTHPSSHMVIMGISLSVLLSLFKRIPLWGWRHCIYWNWLYEIGPRFLGYKTKFHTFGSLFHNDK